MRDRIAESAQLYRRSMNSEIVARLQESYTGLGSNNPEANQETNPVNDQINHQHTNRLEQRSPALNVQLERILRHQLDADEYQISQGYRRLGKTKRDALRKLLCD